MAKQKRRYLKRGKTKNTSVINASKDRHHIMYQRRHYKGVLAELRNHPYCIVLIPKDTMHHKIHEFVGDIPAPRPSSAKEALWHLNYLYEHGGISNDDSIEKRLRVLIALFDCIEQPTADALRKQLSIVEQYGSPR